MIMNKLGLLLALLIFSGSVPLSGHAAILSINNMTITGGTFGLEFADFL